MEEEKCEISKMPSKPHFVMIHGLCGGAWSWFKIKCLLENCSGYKATCLNLKGCGTDPTDGYTIRSFDEYNEPLDEFMDALPKDEKVVLVGYSAGGISVTRALHKFPSKIQMVIYIAATMLKFGFQTPDDLKIGIPDVLEHGLVSEHLTEISSSTQLKKIFVPEFISPIGSSEDFALMKMLSRPAPFGAIAATKFTEDETRDSNSVPRVYIKTLRDRVLKPNQQEAMIMKWVPYQVYSVESDHDILFAHPFVLTSLLIAAVSSVAFEKN